MSDLIRQMQSGMGQQGQAMQPPAQNFERINEMLLKNYDLMGPSPDQDSSPDMMQAMGYDQYGVGGKPGPMQDIQQPQQPQASDQQPTLAPEYRDFGGPPQAPPAPKKVQSVLKKQPKTFISGRPNNFGQYPNTEEGWNQAYKNKDAI